MFKRIRKYDGMTLAVLPLAILLNHCSGKDEKTSPVGISTTTTGGGGQGGGGGAGGATELPDLDPRLEWYGDNRERLDAMIDAHGAASPGYEATSRPVAIFDWDNTVIKNDVGDATVFWVLRNDKVLEPPGKSWAMTSPYLTPAASMMLGGACDGLAEAGQPLPTSTSTACADAILGVYFDGTTADGAPAFAGQNYRTMEPAYAWASALLAGYPPAEIATFATAAINENLAAEEGATQTVGTRSGLTAWIRIYDPIRDLLGVLQKNGFDVWVVSASPQSVVEPFAEKFGVAADRVVGIRQLAAGDGKLTYNLQGCGAVPDGTNDGQGTFTGNSLITYIEGKRCWINKAIYGDLGATASEVNPDRSKRQVFSAGDSDTDVSFLQDATGLRLAINRNKKELMCNAYRNFGGTWLINPMFIAPKGQLAAGYPCSTTGCKSPQGASVPCLDEGAVVIPDQADNVY